MSTEEVIIGVPESPNLKDLAESTRLALSILRPWCTGDLQSSALIDIQRHAKGYVGAISFSIKAAQHGYNVTQDVLAFVPMIDTADEQARQQYFSGMLRIAQEGEKHTLSASNRFRDVRSMVQQLIHAARTGDSQSDHQGDHSALNGLNDLEGGLGALEKFSGCISSYISWWNVIKMTQSATTTRTGQIAVNYNSLRRRDVVNKWKELGQEYVEYSNQIQAIQDSYPDFILPFLSGSEDPPGEQQPGLRPVVIEETKIVNSPPSNPVPFHFPGPLFATRYHLIQQRPMRQRDRIREFSQKLFSFSA